MIIDHLKNAGRYDSLHPLFAKAFEFLESTDLVTLQPRKYEFDGENVFAIVQEYETIDAAKEQLESHKKYIDVQYMIKGVELVGHSILLMQQPSKAYNEEDDFMLFSESPSFFSELEEGMFMIFFPTDLHMPCIKKVKPAMVKKIVIKVKV